MNRNDRIEEINRDRRRFVGTAAMSFAAAQFGVIASANAASSSMSPGGAGASPLTQNPPAGSGDSSLRPFHVSFPEQEIVELRRRVAATRWPDRETVNDDSQGVQLATVQNLARYWATEHHWSKCEAGLNALPQFLTNIDGLDIHFIHVRSKNPNALPVIITHGWPGSIIEQLKVIEPLTNPTAHTAGAHRILSTS